MSANIRWGILGTSFISEVMANAIQESSISELVAIGSRSADTGNAFANKFSVKKTYTDYQQLLDDAEIDAIYIGLPNHLHKEWVIRCAQAGKHILCEKPFVISAKEAEEAFAEVKKASVVCMEALMYRFHPLTKKILELAQSIGDIKLIHAAYTANIASIANPAAGGAIRNLGCYPVSLIRLLTNAEPTDISAFGRINKRNQNDNQASAILKFKNDTLAVVSTADDLEMFWQFEVYGTNGKLKMITNPWLPDRDNNKIIVHRNDQSELIEINVTADKSLYTYQIDVMSNKILDKDAANDSEVTWQDSLGNVIILEAWLSQVKG